MPKINELLLAELEREAAGTRRALERVPEGHDVPVPSLYGPTADEKGF